MTFGIINYVKNFIYGYFMIYIYKLHLNQSFSVIKCYISFVFINFHF